VAPPAVPAPPYSIVTVTWRSAGALAALVDSMNRHLRSDPELIVVENASGEDPSAVASAWRGPARTIAMTGNTGFGAAANRGVAESRGDAVVLLNPDTELLDDGLDRLVELARARRALVGPRLLDAHGSVQPSASGPPTGLWPWLGAVIPGPVQPGPIRARTEAWRLEHEATVAWLTGACIAAPRDLLGDLGPFDPAIRLYGEDLDLGLRAAAAGVPSLFCPNACRIVHHGGASTSLTLSGPESARLRTANRRAVIRRAAGPNAEHLAWLAQRANLRLRLAAKAGLRIDRDRERLELAATRAATTVEELPPALSGRPARRHA
jgi:N-acetylglucosaminyl-diphospho-decaprenol L-rhamnosyltransferase